MGKYSRTLAHVAICAFAVAGSGTLQAAAISGTFNINGSVRVTPLAFDWFAVGPGGTVNVVPPVEGYFGGMTGTATIKDLISPDASPGFPIDSFLSGFGGAFAGFSVDQVLFVLPSAPACLGNIAENTSCSLGNSTLTQLSGGVTVSVNVTGIFNDGVNTPTGATGRFTTQLGSTNGTVQGILNSLGTTGFIDSSFSATFTSVPEPATYALVGAALLALAARKRFGR